MITCIKQNKILELSYVKNQWSNTVCITELLAALHPHVYIILRKRGAFIQISLLWNGVSKPWGSIRDAFGI